MMITSTTEQKVAAAETELKVKLPKEYRDRLMSNNGGELATAGGNWRIFPVLDSSNPKRAEKTANHIVKENRDVQKLTGFPKGAIAIAKNKKGDFLVFLSANGNGTLIGKVHVWNHETHECQAAPLDFE